MTPRWSVDEQALERARERLGLSYGVRVALADFRQDAARYRGLVAGYHRISLSRDICVWQAGVALWHELTHAQQFETIDDFWEAYRQSPATFEDLATANESLNGWIPLCLPC